MNRAAEDIRDDDPMTLSEASQYLRGKVTVSALRAEIRRGNLSVERIGKNLFTTPAAIREMRDKCRVTHSRPDCISEPTVPAKASGSSATKGETNELAALKASVAALKSGSLSTLHKSTPRSHPKAADPIPFRSPK